MLPSFAPTKTLAAGLREDGQAFADKMDDMPGHGTGHGVETATYGKRWNLTKPDAERAGHNRVRRGAQGKAEARIAHEGLS